MSAAILEGRTLRAYTDGLGQLDNAVHAPRVVPCPCCKGTGGNLFTVDDYPTFDPAFWMDCEVCDGTGSVTHLFGVHPVFEGHPDTPALLGESAEIIASGGAASGSPRPDSEDTGAAGGHPVHMLTDDTDDPTMDAHLALHPEDALCPECCGVGPHLENIRCPRCLNDGRRGEDCILCGGDGGWWDDEAEEWTLCPAPGCRWGRLVEATDGE